MAERPSKGESNKSRAARSGVLSTQPPTIRSAAVKITKPPCRFINTPNGCRNGQSCPFLHVTDTNSTASGSDSNTQRVSGVLCRHFAAGNCPFADKCWFSHDLGSATPSGSGTNKTQETKPEPSACMICFEEEPSQYGLLAGCSHSFCLSCIRSWRKTSGKDVEMVMSGVIKSCPSCRTQSHYVIPSSVFYREGDPRKERTIASYKENLSKVPCRRFEENLRQRGRAECPFGRDCFYLHLNEDGTKHEFEQGIETTMRQCRERREAAEARRRAQQMRDLTATLSAFAESLLLNDPDGLAEFDDDDEFEDRDDEEDESDWADDGVELWGDFDDLFVRAGSFYERGHNYRHYFDD